MEQRNTITTLVKQSQSEKFFEGQNKNDNKFCGTEKEQ